MRIRETVNDAGQRCVEITDGGDGKVLRVGGVQFEWDIFAPLSGVMAASLVSPVGPMRGILPSAKQVAVGSGRTAYKAIADLADTLLVQTDQNARR